MKRVAASTWRPVSGRGRFEGWRSALWHRFPRYQRCCGLKEVRQEPAGDTWLEEELVVRGLARNDVAYRFIERRIGMQALGTALDGVEFLRKVGLSFQNRPHPASNASGNARVARAYRSVGLLRPLRPDRSRLTRQPFRQSLQRWDSSAAGRASIPIWIALPRDSHRPGRPSPCTSSLR